MKKPRKYGAFSVETVGLEPGSGRFSEILLSWAFAEKSVFMRVFRYLCIFTKSLKSYANHTFLQLCNTKCNTKRAKKIKAGAMPALFYAT